MEAGFISLPRKQIDYLFVSDALKARLDGVHIERRGAYARSHWTPYPTVTKRSEAASDHSADFADFNI